MEQNRWGEVKEIFHEALQLEPSEWESFLEETCGGDHGLLAEVASLLAADEDSLPWLDAPVFQAAAETLARDRWLEPGRSVGAYKTVRRLGQGGMGTVYLAERADQEYQSQVAIKLIRPDLVAEDVVVRFRQERQILATLDHPFIAKMLDGGETEDGLPYFIMEYIEGRPIDVYCDENQLAPDERIALFQQVCSAVQYAHGNLVVHCDLKPSNILVTKEGIPKLLDFGIARLLGTKKVPRVTMRTMEGSWGLTPEYASPEQVDNERPTMKSDVYSLGVLLYRLLTGRLPFHFENRVKPVQQPTRPSSIVALATGDASPTWQISAERLRRVLVGDLDNIILMAMHNDALRRYSSVEQFSEDLRRYRDGLPVLARKDTFTYRLSKFVRRNRIWVGAAALVAISLLVGIAATTRAAYIANFERLRSEEQRRGAEEISTFLENLFKEADPYETKQVDVTVRQFLDRAVEQIDRDLKDQGEVQARMMNTMGVAYQHFESLDKAADLIESALKIRREELGERSLEYAESLFSLCSLKRKQVLFDEAEKRCREALAIQVQLSGEKSIDVARTLSRLALILRSKSDFKEAKNVYQQALDVFEQIGWDESKDYAVALHNFGAFLFAQGNLIESEVHIRLALDLYASVLPEKNPRLAAGWNTLAVVLKNQGRFDEAEDFYLKALRARREILGEGHSNVVTTLVNLGSLYHAQRKFDAAFSTYEEAWSVARENLKDGNLEFANIRHGLGLLQHDLGDHLEAEVSLREAIEVRLAKRSEDDLSVAWGRIDLGRILLALNRNAEAESILRQGLNVREHKLPEGNWQTANAQSLLGESLMALGRRDEAEPFLLKGHQTLINGPEARRHLARQALQRLVALYDGWNKEGEYEMFRRRLRELDSP